MNQRIVVITGGNRGIGLDITRCFIQEGYKVFILARNEYSLIDEFGDKICFLKTDLRNYTEIEKSFEIIKNANKNIDVLVNNAGISAWSSIENVTEQFLDNMLSINLKAFFWTSKFSVPMLTDGGAIINISSIAGKRGSANNSVYCATKFGINGLTQSLAKELGPRNIRVNALCPVLILTDGLNEALTQPEAPAYGKDPEEFIKNFTASNSALGRMPMGSEVAQMCLFLASNNASAITGQCINVDCGVFPQ
jgi:NAD(P)-dependent dehydrogenase (short-subunit alcohol dehydrogenase family)